MSEESSVDSSKIVVTHQNVVLNGETRTNIIWHIGDNSAVTISRLNEEIFPTDLNDNLSGVPGLNILLGFGEPGIYSSFVF
jgi:hypothetical protein